MRPYAPFCIFVYYVLRISTATFITNNLNRISRVYCVSRTISTCQLFLPEALSIYPISIGRPHKLRLGSNGYKGILKARVCYNGCAIYATICCRIVSKRAYELPKPTFIDSLYIFHQTKSLKTFCPKNHFQGLVPIQSIFRIRSSPYGSLQESKS